ncbi:exosome complex component RRP46 [Ostrinia furnacalis]|uniref:exosome complex component RRP46 n=1 Tax=Ostrinia furnacalis TaxID=93504 RepID=UPI00103BE1A1|nr:exosome complex component RRP46 [Ostrinia furnacalis]
MGADEKDFKDFKLQPMKCELNFLSKSDGSAILSQGDTVALVSVNGPLDIKTTSQSIEKSTLEILYSSKGGKPSVADRYKENVIRQTCEKAILGSLYPRTGITVTIQELEDFGGFLSCALNCACLALLNSGVAMRHVFACVSCSVDARGEVRLAGRGEAAQLSCVFDGVHRNLITCFSEGTYSEGTYFEAVAKCRAASEVIFAFYRDVVAKYSRAI